MEVSDILELLTKMRDRNYYFPERDALTIAIELVHSRKGLSGLLLSLLWTPII